MCKINSTGETTNNLQANISLTEWIRDCLDFHMQALPADQISYYVYLSEEYIYEHPIARMPIGNIKIEDIKEFIRYILLSRGASKSNILGKDYQIMLYFLSSLLNVAVYYEYINYNPCEVLITNEISRFVSFTFGEVI